MNEPTDLGTSADVGQVAETLPPPSAGREASRRTLLIVFLVVFIDLLGFGIVLPLLPRYGESYISALVGTSHGWQNGVLIGLLMSSFSLMQFLFSPVWGRVSDRLGRRPVLLIGLSGSVVFYALLGFASDLPVEQATLALTLLFVARIGAGLAGATIATAQAVIADSTPPEKRKHGMALIGAAFGIGFTFGPLVGFASLKWFPEHHGAIGYAAACLSLLALLLGMRLLPETRRFGAAPPVKRRWLDWSAMRQALRNPGLAPVVLTFFLATFGFAGFESTLALLLKDAMQFDPDQSFLIFAYVGFVLMLTQGFLYRRLARRLTEPTFIAIGIVLMGLGVLSLGGVSLESESLGEGLLLAWLLVSLAVAVIGFAFLTPSAQALISRRTDADRQGEVLGVNQSAAALARILGPLVGLTLYKMTATHLLPYLFGAALLLVMLPLLPSIRRG
jgi:MFS family permease